MSDADPPVGRLTILSGPTAVGKGTVMARLRTDHPDVWISVSATTRPPRPGELDGVHYLFVSEEEFDDLVASDALLEWAVVHGRHRYGTPSGPVDAALATGRPALVEVDLQGARQIRRRCPDAQFVFLAPPDRDELVRRLVGRGTEGRAEQERRLQTAELELAAVDEFDHVVVNGEIAQAVADLVGLLGSTSHPLS